MASAGPPDLVAPAALDDPYPGYARLRREAPVWRIPGTRTWLVTTWALVSDATGRADDFSSNLTALLVSGPDGRLVEYDMTGLGTAIDVLATADDPGHATHRRIVFPHLVPARLQATEPQLRLLAADLWREGAAGGAIEWMSGMADRMPLTVVAAVIGLPAGDVPQLLTWAYEGTELLSGVATLDRMDYLGSSAAAMGEYLAARFALARASPPPSLLGDLAVAANDGLLSDHEVVAALVQLVGAGGESTAGLIGNAARILAEQPDLQDRLRADPELIPPFLEEVLRVESPFRGHYRLVRRDCRLGGVELCAGDHLVLHWGAANRDGAVFADADRIVLDRPAGRAHLAFGRGLHFCVGAPLARLEARVAIGTLVSRTRSFGLDDTEAPVWVPSIFVRRLARLRLAIRPA
jgi:cytochrome P450